MRTGFRFTCLCSGRCCRVPGRVYLLLDDAQLVADGLGVRVDQFIAQYTEIVEVEYRFTDTVCTRRWLTLRRDSMNACVFLRENRCSIHETKPGQCRDGPFTIGILTNTEELEKFISMCPGAGRGQLVSTSEIQRKLAAQLAGLETFRSSNQSSDLTLLIESISPSEKIVQTYDCTQREHFDAETGLASQLGVLENTWPSDRGD